MKKGIFYAGSYKTGIGSKSFEERFRELDKVLKLKPLGSFWGIDIAGIRFLRSMEFYYKKKTMKNGDILHIPVLKKAV